MIAIRQTTLVDAKRLLEIYDYYVKNYMLFVNDNVQKSEGYYIVKIYNDCVDDSFYGIAEDLQNDILPKIEQWIRT